MQPAAENEVRNARRILVRGVNWLGDAVMSTPALLRLKEAYPASFIGLLIPDKLGDLFLDHPAVDAILRFTPQERFFSVAARLRGERYDLGLILPNSFRSALELWWARIPIRIGRASQLRRGLLTLAVPERAGAVDMRKRSRREVLRLNRGTNRTERDDAPSPAVQLNPEAAAHHIHQYLHLVQYAGASATPAAPQLFPRPAEVEAFKRRFELGTSAQTPLFGLNPGGEYGPAKRWPAEYFIEAARQIQERTQCRWVIFGGAADVELASQVAAGIDHGPSKQSRAINAAGTTSLRELCAGLKACELVLTNDTGPMHVAAAVGTPVVVPFGSTSPELTGPGLPGGHRHVLLRAHVPCAPCFRRECPIQVRCLREIEAGAVVQAVLDAWRRNGVRSRE